MTLQKAMRLSPEEREEVMIDLMRHGGKQAWELRRQIKEEEENREKRDKNEKNDLKLGSELARMGAVQPTTAGRRAGVTMPRFFVEDEDGKPIAGKSGRSRKEALIQHRVVTSFRSWQERVKAVNTLMRLRQRRI